MRVETDLFDQELPRQLACGVEMLDGMREFIKKVVSAALSGPVLCRGYKRVGAVQHFDGSAGGEWSLLLKAGKNERLYVEYHINMGTSRWRTVFSSMPGEEHLLNEHVRIVRAALPVLLKGLQMLVA